jgi:hypothetical protein
MMTSQQDIHGCDCVRMLANDFILNRNSIVLLHNNYNNNRYFLKNKNQSSTRYNKQVSVSRASSSPSGRCSCLRPLLLLSETRSASHRNLNSERALANHNVYEETVCAARANALRI